MQTKPPFALRIVAIAVCTMMAVEPAVLAQTQPGPFPTQTATPPTQTAAAAPTASGATFTQKDLDELLAPVALYPDALLSQVLMASTYPLEVVEAARWQKANSTLKDKALEDALTSQTWDPAVKSLTTVPQVLTMMNEKLDWTTKLGDAFLANQENVLKTVQNLRKKADEAGNLKTSQEMTVKKETEGSVQVIKIEQPNPEVVYVPTYNPATIYGPWWYPAPPPYYYYPPGYAYGAGLAFATGVVVGAAIWGNIGWGNNNVNVNVNKYNNFNKTNINNGNWNHNVDHRKGAAYRDSGTAQKYNRGGNAQSAQSRDQFRGRAEQGRSEMSQNRAGDRSGGAQAGNRGATAQTSDRGGGGNPSSRDAGGSRGGGSSSSSRGSSSSSGFSGAGGGGSSARAASSRGSSSMGGGGARGGGGGGRGGGGRR
ncbi:MAG TPA: DUF3300 domain-containing protein [Usitatibacter sp.]|jgi:uncharacterized protein DUF3300|nr:DUF3300 domain-containing protein [Usitatibacter sp.]